ncbi:MAG: hypothetical protein JNN17_15330 [Verrucomicrobiaceae bacterium]|nr:hypothetical protein [Verrucomicrobiaceae bacterium]
MLEAFPITKKEFQKRMSEANPKLQRLEIAQVALFLATGGSIAFFDIVLNSFRWFWVWAVVLISISVWLWFKKRSVAEHHGILCPNCRFLHRVRAVLCPPEPGNCLGCGYQMLRSESTEVTS